ncbi:uncharacterized protein LOC142101950 [Mixophyes fleayi]|uniref:uncharacterized protein LOC142101950 n=1 Tax=Mixophyes fleayi TaxID=3061075 RepID=UPI003F4DD8EC
MIQSKHFWRAVEIQEKAGSGRPPGTKARTAIIPKKQWSMRRRDNTSGHVVVSEKKRRGRPPLTKPVNLDMLKKEESARGNGTTDESTGVSNKRQSMQRAAKIPKTETLMIPISYTTEDTRIPEKRKRGRPPINRALNVDIPKTEESERAIGNRDEDTKFVEKRGRGRPLGSVNKKILVQNKPSTSFQSLDGQKRGRGRPRKTELLLLNKAPNMSKFSAMTKQIAVRLTKMNEDIVTMAGKKIHLKAEKNTITGENKKVERKTAMIKKKKIVKVKQNSVEKKKMKQKNIVVELTDIIREKKKVKKVKSTEVASVTVVLEKRRGRPKKQPASAESKEQVALLCPNTWPENFKYEGCQAANQLPGDFSSHREHNPTEIGVCTRQVELLQIPQEAHCPSVEPQSSLESEETVNEEVPTYQYSQWETKPAHTHTVWTADDGVESLDSNSVTQFVVGEPTAPQPSQSQYSKGPVPEQLNFQQDLLRGLSDFRCQLTRELAATRGEVRDGAECVRSAIAGVSAEIHRLGLILQPLVNVITTGNLFCRPPNYAPMTSMLHPQQETPPDDTMDVPQSSMRQKNPFANRHEDTPLDHLTPRDTPTDCSTESLPEVISLVKTEDPMDNPQPCTYQAQSIVSLQVDTSIAQPLLLPHHDIPSVFSMRSSRKVTTSVIPDFCMNIPHVNSLDSRQEDCSSTHSALLSDHKAPTADSLRPPPPVSTSANHDDFMDNSPQRHSPPIISVLHYDNDKSSACSLGSPDEDSSPAKPIVCRSQNPFPINSQEHPEMGTNSVHRPCMSPTHSHGSSQVDIDRVLDCSSIESNTVLCQTQDVSAPNLTTPPVTVPDPSTDNSPLTALDQAVNLEGICLKDTLSKSSAEFSEMPHTTEVCTFPQSVCSQPKMLPESVFTSQTPPTSPLASTTLLQMDGEVSPMLQSVAD